MGGRHGYVLQEEEGLREVGGMRFRGTGRGSGKIRFKRRLNVEWRVEDYSELSVAAGGGDLIEAVTFGDPCASPAKGSFSVGGVEFFPFRASTVFKLASSTGRVHEVVDGPFFAQRVGSQTDRLELSSLGTLGAWVPNLPPGEFLSLEMRDLVPDAEYEARLVFHDGRGRASSKIRVEPGGLTFETLAPLVVVGRFVAPGNSVTLQIYSETDRAPFVNAAVVRAGSKTPPATFAFTR